MADTHGLFGSLFCDFGDDFVVVDSNGDNPTAAGTAHGQL